MNNLKIITAFHGAVIHSNAFDDPEIYVPVYGGRSVSRYLPDRSKRMLADNTGENISWMNPYVGELTCIYWASKNLDKLGNPDYIGLNHYRRLFPIRQYLEKLKNIDRFVLTSTIKTNIPVLRYADLKYGIKDDLEQLFDKLLQTDEERSIYQSFEEQTDYAEKNLFVMPTEELAGYIDFIMRAINILYPDFQFQYLEGMQYKRKTARMLEFVTAYYLLRLAVLGCERLTINYEYPWKGFC